MAQDRDAIPRNSPFRKRLETHKTYLKFTQPPTSMIFHYLGFYVIFADPWITKFRVFFLYLTVPRYKCGENSPFCDLFLNIFVYIISKAMSGEILFLLLRNLRKCKIWYMSNVHV